MYYHWAERIADEIIKSRKEPYVITGGMTTSGPAHLGTVCEFLFPNAIAKVLKKRGKEVKFYFVADIMDAFDSIPKSVERYREMLEEHLGKPLYTVPDPFGCHESFGDHYLSEAIGIMKAMGVETEIVKAQELYFSGAFDKYALIFIKNIDKVKEILEKVSKRQLKKTWNPIMPICEKCGKISTTKVINYEIEGDDVIYEYECSNDVGYVKGCGFKGKSSIKKHKYKLQWRLHWPSWWHYFKSSAEGGGVDHFTKGGSRDTGVVIFKSFFKSEPPIGFKYGFVLLKGKKFSKSKGTGMSVKEMIELIPAKVVAYHLLKFDLEENIDFNPTKENILHLIEDYEKTSEIKKEMDEMSRAERKKWIAYELAGKREWRGSFREVLMYYQIYKDVSKIKLHLDIDEKSLRFILPYIKKWIEKEFVPDDYNFSYNPRKAEGSVKEFLSSLKDSMSALDIHNFVYEFSRAKGIEPREMFKAIYKTLIGKDRGPRLGKLIYALGVERVKKDCL